MTEFFKVTLGAGGKINFATTTSLTLVPEPSSLAIAGLGGLGLVGLASVAGTRALEPSDNRHTGPVWVPTTDETAPAAHAGGGFILSRSRFNLHGDRWIG